MGCINEPGTGKTVFFWLQPTGDWRPGGAITWTGEYEGKTYIDKGIIQEYVPNEKLSFTYLSSWSGKEDIPENYLFVTYAVKPVDEGTELTITQTNYDDEKAKHSAENWGW
ncbi:SRPBCC domain-containing protein [Niabella defluvii]|nr:SRPBCC domain-containing protein [Niabella sp. I65]